MQPTELESVDPYPSGGSPAFERLASRQLSADPLSNGVNPADVLVTNIDNDTITDELFKHWLSGTLLGSWTIDAANSLPAGITIDPNNVSDIWIVDSGADTVFQYIGAASRTSGSQIAWASVAPAAGTTHPQVIASPSVGPAPSLAPPPLEATRLDPPHAAFDGPLDPILPAGHHTLDGELDSLFAALPIFGTPVVMAPEQWIDRANVSPARA